MHRPAFAFAAKNHSCFSMHAFPWSLAAPNCSLDVCGRMGSNCVGVKEAFCSARSFDVATQSKFARDTAASGRPWRLSCRMAIFRLPARKHGGSSVQVLEVFSSTGIRAHEGHTFNQIAAERKGHQNRLSFAPLIADIQCSSQTRSVTSVARRQNHRNSTFGRYEQRGRPNTNKCVRSDISNEIQDINMDDLEDDDESTQENDPFIDDLLEEEGEGGGEIVIGDGGDGGGVAIGRTEWGEKALAIAKEVLEAFSSNFSLYAFRVFPEGRVHVRLDKLSDKYGSPSMVEIESFCSIYGKRLEEAGEEGILPNNLALEVSSPGAERVLEIPRELLRFKDLPMYVRYIEVANGSSDGDQAAERDGVFELESVEIESGNCTWKIANVRLNREQAGKGRGLNKKQRDWRAQVPFSSLRLVRLYLDI